MLWVTGTRTPAAGLPTGAVPEIPKGETSLGPQQLLKIGLLGKNFDGSRLFYFQFAAGFGVFFSTVCHWTRTFLPL